VAPSDDYAPQKKLACIDIHAKRPKTEDLTGDPMRRAPDLCLTFDTLDNYSPDKFFSGAVVAIEVKSDVNADPGFIARDAPGTLRSKQGRRAQAPTNAAAELLLQAFNYVSSQWAELPYRFLWSITIARDVLRIWRWSASGVMVTEAIDYIKDATPVYQFLQAIGKGPYSRLGLDIGLGRAFRGVERKMGAQVKQIVDCYLEATTKTELQVKWSTRALQSAIWRFEQASSIPVSTKVVEGSNLTETDQSPENEDFTTDISPLYVLSHPIWRGRGVYSRGTRCYLAVSQSTLDKQEEITVEDLRMLKTSWQTAGDSQESVFFSCVQAAHEERVPHLATMLAAVYNLPSTL
jgi:Fungal protein kinase